MQQVRSRAALLVLAALGGCSSRSLDLPLGTIENGGDMGFAVPDAGGCSCAPNPPCGFDGTCDGNGNCNYFAAMTPCLPASCTNGLVSAGAFCDGAGSCEGPAAVQCPAPLHGTSSCDGDICGFTCDDGYAPSGMSCVPVWTVIATNTTLDLSTIAGRGADDIFIGATPSSHSVGYLIHGDGKGFGFAAPTQLPIGFPNKIAVQGPRVFIGGLPTLIGQPTLIVSSGVSGSWKSITPAPTSYVYALWAASGNDSTVIAVGLNEYMLVPAITIYENGAVVSNYVMPNVNKLTGVWASSASDVYVTTDDAPYSVWHTSTPTVATSWIRLTVDGASMLPATAVRMWGSGASDIYIVGSAGMILHSTGDGTFSRQNSGVSAPTLIGVWGTGPNDVYAVGTGGTILHSTGDGTWTQEQSPTTDPLYDVWGSGPDDVYIVGAAGTLLHKK